MQNSTSPITHCTALGNFLQMELEEILVPNWMADNTGLWGTLDEKLIVTTHYKIHLHNS